MMNVYDDKSFKFSKQQDPVGQNGALGAHVHNLVVEAAEAGAGGGFFSFFILSLQGLQDFK